MTTAQRNQHYVWKHYLKAWAVEKKVWCIRAPETIAFPANPSKIASETFFYRFNELDGSDLQHLDDIIASATREGLQDINRGWIKYFQYSFRVRKALESGQIKTLDRAGADAALDLIEKTIGETYMAAVENRAQPILQALRARDTSIPDDPIRFMGFADFISHQYWRTAKLRNAMLVLQPLVSHNVSRTWPIERFVYATNMASSMVGDRQRYGLHFLDNQTSIPFIAGDQPVINLNGHKDETLRLYYPLSPDLALIYTLRDGSGSSSSNSVSLAVVEALNTRIYAQSDSQIYSNDRAYVENIIKRDKFAPPHDCLSKL